jgi:Fic family protein
MSERGLVTVSRQESWAIRRLSSHSGGTVCREGIMEIQVWRPITDLESSLATYRDPELSALVPVWKSLRQALQGTPAMKTFNDRLARAWAVETGILERLYTVDRGVTNLLIEQGFDASLIPHGSSDRSPEELVEILKAHGEALNGLFAFVSGARPFGASFIKELHVVLTRAQDSVLAVDESGHQFHAPLLRGQWKALPNNPRRSDGTTFVYCPPMQVDSEMDRFVLLRDAHEGIAPEVRSAWIHHRFTQIHPFQDGNGRVARALATLEFLKDDLLPLVIDRDDRSDYISALERADTGDLRPLIDLFAKLERGALLRAMSLAEATLHEAANIQRSAASLARHLRTSYLAPQVAVQQAGIVASGLMDIVSERLAETMKTLEAQFRENQVSVEVSFARSDEENNHFFQAQIIQVANKFDYFANTRSRRWWARLHLRDHFRTDLIVSAHAVGYSPQGAMACTVFLNERLERQIGESPEWKVTVACDAPFTFSHATDVGYLKPSFEDWLNRSITLGLNLISASI